MDSNLEGKNIERCCEIEKVRKKFVIKPNFCCEIEKICLSQHY